MPTEPIIRIASLRDYPAVDRLLRELDDHHVRLRPDVFQSLADPIRQRERVTGLVSDDNAQMFVAEINSQIVGLATVRISENPVPPMFRRGRRAWMDDLVVQREFRGLGIAKKLLDHMIEWMGPRELPCLVVNVWNGNKDGLSFFAKNGFTTRSQQMELRLEKAT